MPFCLSNNTAGDIITLHQRKTSWASSISIAPLASCMWTLPHIEGEMVLDVYVRPVGEEQGKSAYSVMLTIETNHPGRLGAIKLKNPNRIIYVSMEMQRSTRLILFDEGKKELFSMIRRKKEINYLHYLREKKSFLLKKLGVISNEIEEKTNEVTQYIKELEENGSGIPPSACSTYLQVVNGYDFELSAGRKCFTKVVVKHNDKKCESSYNRNDIPFYNLNILIANSNRIEMMLYCKYDLVTESIGRNDINLEDMNEKDHLYDIEAPFYNNDGVFMGYVNIQLINVSCYELAESMFQKEALNKRKKEVETVLLRLQMESYIEKTIPQKKLRVLGSSRYINRAIGSGIYKSKDKGNKRNTISISEINNVENEDEDNESIENNMSYCILLKKIMRMPLTLKDIKKVYGIVKIGSAEMRTPVNVVDSDPTVYEKEIVMDVSGELGCDFVKEGNTFYVKSVVDGGYVAIHGGQVGCILSSINNGDLPPDLESLNQLLDSNELLSITLLSPPVESYLMVDIEQQLVFPAGITIGEKEMNIQLYEESNTDTDNLLVQSSIPISRESELCCSYRLSRDYCICVESSWESFDVDNDLLEMSVGINIKGVALSVVNKAPEELLYISINRIVLDYYEYEVGKQMVEFKINVFQVDNQIIGAKYPVLFGSPSADKEKDWLHLSFILLPHPSVIYIEYLGLLLQEMRVSSDTRIWFSLVQFVQDLPLHLLTSKATALGCYDLLHQYPSFIETMIIPQQEINGTSLFAEEFQLQPMLISLTNKVDSAYPLKSLTLTSSLPFLVPFQALIDAASHLLGNIDNAQMKLNSFLASNLFVTKEDLSVYLVSHYRSQFLKQLYKVFGALNLIGNPVSLFENIGSGVIAFFYEPIQGIVKSPKEFVGGLGKGTKKLISNTTYGLFNTIGMITNTIGDGLSQLSMNKEYMADRAAGKSGTIRGVKEGITGLYKDTARGAKKGGVVGGLQGAMKAVVGVVVKPLVGVVDDTTKVIQSVKGIARKEIVIDRVRDPRYIHMDGSLPLYNSYLSYGQVLLTLCKNSAKVPTVDYYVIHIQTEKETLVVSNSRLCSIVNKKVVDVLKYKHIKKMVVNQRSVMFTMDNDEIKHKVMNEKIACIMPILINSLQMKRKHVIVCCVIEILKELQQPLMQEEILVAEKVLAEWSYLCIRSTSVPNEGTEKKESVSLAMIPIKEVAVSTYHDGKEAVTSMIGQTNKTYTEYEITVIGEGYQWVVYRRFTQFSELLDILKSQYPEQASELKLPGKQMKLLQKLAKSVMEKRVGELDVFIKAVSVNPEFMKNESVVSFLTNNVISVEKM